MERVEELRHELEEAHNMFRMAQDRKHNFLQEVHKTIMNKIVSCMTENLRSNIQEYFEQRNESLRKALNSIDESLNEASDSHAAITSFRTKLIEACNEQMQPQINVTGTDLADPPLLIYGQGVDDLQAVSSETESCILQVNNLQDKYCKLMSDIEEKVPEKIGAILSEMEGQIKIADEARYNEALAILQRSEAELDKAVQILDSMEKMKQQMECLFQILRKPSTST